MEQLTVSSQVVDGWTILRIVGQLDVATAPDLRQHLIEAQYGGGRRVALDLDGVEFIDSFGLGVLVGAVRRANSHEGEIVVVCARERVRHVLELAGLDRVLRLLVDVEELDASA